MADTNWVQLAAGLTGGGLAGAILTNLVGALRNRRQPIGYRVDVVPVFKGTLADSHLIARLKVVDPTGPVELDNLFLAEIQLVNRGNRDWPQLPLGITLGGGEALDICMEPYWARPASAALVCKSALGSSVPQVNGSAEGCARLRLGSSC